jgi:DNA-binding NtrC family response regulator
MPGKALRALVVDDQLDVLEALRLLLKSEGFEITTAQSPAAALSAIEKEDFDVALMDLNYARDTTSGQEGLDLLARVQALDATLPVVVMTAWGTIGSAVEAMRRGARDYVQKPWENPRLLATLRTQGELACLLRKSRRLEGELARQASPEAEPIAASSAMREVLRMVEKIAPSDASVLITGEHGTGKEVIARWIHALSPRRKGPFIAVNSGGLSDGVLESELFGHVRGAFTDAKTDRIGCFEMADEGTLFLDEIGNMPLGQQAKLLRALQTGEFRPVGSTKMRHARARIVAATNADLAQEIAKGQFREDLLYRLNTVEVRVPALRERREDIGLLAQHFLERRAAQYRKPVVAFAPSALQAMLAHSWPGNVRELEHVVERAVLMAAGTEVTEQDLVVKSPSGAGGSRVEDMTLEQAERHLIERALARADGNVSHAAKALGLSRSALYRRLEHFGMSAKG